MPNQRDPRTIRVSACGTLDATPTAQTPRPMSGLRQRMPVFHRAPAIPDASGGIRMSSPEEQDDEDCQL